MTVLSAGPRRRKAAPPGAKDRLAARTMVIVAFASAAVSAVFVLLLLLSLTSTSAITAGR